MERDYPVGHPSACDYKGEPYEPPKAPHAEDFPKGHPARGGKNISDLDTPDGAQALTVREWHENAQRTAAGIQDEAAPQEPHGGAETQEVTTTISITGEVTTA